MPIVQEIFDLKPSPKKNKAKGDEETKSEDKKAQ
jgi:hypothetical protein